MTSHYGVPDFKDTISQPPHYSRHKIQPLDFILANRLGYVEGNVIKYVCRWQHKGGIEDLKKAREYLDKYINSLESPSASFDPHSGDYT